MERYSKKRELILNVLRSRNDHPTADMLYKEIVEIMPQIGIATIYRNLSSLSESGKIVKIETKQGEPDRFDGETKPHIHLNCIECNNLYDIFISDEQYTNLNDELKNIGKIIDAEITNTNIILKGKCKKCRDK